MTNPPRTPLDNTTFSPHIDTVFGRYRVFESLGKGGVGEVFRARDTELDRSVAVKVLHTQDDPSGLGLTRAGAASLLREARLAATLHHPNAVTVFDAAEQDGVPYLVMELVDGATLRTFIGDPKITVERKIGWLIGIARALAAAHAKGIIHRDVKPENVMLRDDDVIKVLDFGIARRVIEAEATSPGGGPVSVYGTPAYVAPERALGEAGDALADQFSWGVLAYELLVGEHPWGIDSPLTRITERMLAHAAPSLPSVACADIPPEIGAVIMRTLARRPKDRFASMGDVVEALIHGWSGTAPYSRFRDPAWQRAFAVVAIAAIAVGAWALTPPRPARGAAHFAAPAPRPSAAWPDFGSPMSKNPEATAAYRAGMESIRQASNAAARRSFVRATELDPAFAAARLRKALATPFVGDAERADIHKAFQLRAALSEHDRALLQAIAPWFDAPRDAPEVERRLVALVSARADADFLYQLCRIRIIDANYRRAIDACRAAREVDPSSAGPIWLEAQGRLMSGDTPGGSDVIDECLRRSPRATSCHNDFLQLRSQAGACRVAFEEARDLVASDPDDPNWLAELGIATCGTGGSISSARAIFDESARHAPRPSMDAERATFRAYLAVYEGDFGEAAKQLDAWDAADSRSLDEPEHADAFRLRAALLREIGDETAIVPYARAYLAGRPAWTPDPRGSGSIDAYVALYRARAMSASAFAAARTTWLDAGLAKDARDNGDVAAWRWLVAYGHAVVTTDDAAEALAHLPDLPPPDRRREIAYDEAIGAALLASGRRDEAITNLRRATTSCRGAVEPVYHTRAHLELGRALEASDPKAACAAYQVVVDRWGDAPLSRSAPIARARQRALGCR